MKKRLAVTTLGCKANQYDSFFIQDYLMRSGFELSRSEGDAELCIINTCTVTDQSDYQSRQAIRRAIRKNPGARIVVTGCYAVREPESIRTISGVSNVLPFNRIKEFLEEFTTCTTDVSGMSSGFPFVEKFPGRTRAFFKIQDGCNFNCSFCAVPSARGRSRSLETKRVIEGLEKYAELGFREVVLTGVHLGSYGTDLEPPCRLEDLLELISEKIYGIRIRLSSLDPQEVTERIIRSVWRSAIFCKHFHIPLQSGDDSILKRMRRRYSSALFSEKVNEIKQKIPDATIGTDVIAGFPGEGDEEFLNTCRLLENLPVSYLHVFPFSVRKGTEAAKMEGRLTKNEIKERVRRLISLGDEKRKQFYMNNIGKEAYVLVEEERVNGHCSGFTDNYIPVVIKNASIPQNTLVQVRIEEVDKGRVLASLI